MCITAKNPDAPIPAFMVFGGMEPLNFTNMFPVWEKNEEIVELQKQVGQYVKKSILVFFEILYIIHIVSRSLFSHIVHKFYINYSLTNSEIILLEKKFE